jgi:RimJ/RimL family protein N-acetyltransferase
MTLILDGERVYLRKLVKDDLTLEYLSWLNDSKVNKYLEVGRSTCTMKDLKEYYKKISSAKNNHLFAIITKKEKKHIGNVRLGSIDYSNRNASLGIMIGNRSYLGKGLGPEVIKIISNYAFDELKLHKLFLYVVSENKRAIKAYIRAGFRIVGEFRDHTFLNGRFYDMTVMELVKR